VGYVPAAVAHPPLGLLERPLTRFALLLIVLLGAALRLYRVYDYPPGLDEDEVKLLVNVCFHPNRFALAPDVALIQCQLWHYLDTWWAIRLYPIACSILTPIGGFLVARTFGATKWAALLAAFAFAALPWSIIHGKVTYGGEVVLLLLLTLYACASTLKGLAGWREAGIAALSTILLLLGYQIGKVVIPITMIALALSPRRGKLAAGFALGLLLYLPTANALYHLEPATYQRNPAVGPLGILAPYLTVPTAARDGIVAPASRWYANATTELAAFVIPSADVNASTMSVPPLSPIPWPLLVVALLCPVVIAGRKARIFWLVAFGACFAPAALTAVTTHRMIAALTVIPIMAALTLSELPRYIGAPLSGVLCLLMLTFTPRAYADWVWADYHHKFCFTACPSYAKDDPFKAWPAHWRDGGRILDLDSLKGKLP
jgi:hypothetical protein